MCRDGTDADLTVDPTPFSVVPASNVRHGTGTRLLVVHDNASVDGVVESWPTNHIEYREGTRHLLSLQGRSLCGWIPLVNKDGLPVLRNSKDQPTTVEKAAAPSPAVSHGSGDQAGTDSSQLFTLAAKMFIRSGCDITTEKLGAMKAGTPVRLLEQRETERGSSWGYISSIPGDAVKVTIALNEFNHSVHRFHSAAEYEAARANYLEDIVEKEALVEDAITGNKLRIKDQTLHISTSTDAADNLRPIPADWKVEHVLDLVKILLIPSPNRAHGCHSTQPVLVRAGPGTGKTWMAKQAVFTLADRLLRGGGNGIMDGIRLVPIVVFVQRIIYLLRESGSTKQTSLLRRYIESIYSGKKMEAWCEMLMQAYEMRALIVLLDGVDEAAGLRDQIDVFVHREIVPSCNRVLVTTRPEGILLSSYSKTFVVMNLCQLSNEQQRRVINIQMEGNPFFDHLLSLGEVRKRLDTAYRKLGAIMRADIESLWAPSAWLLPGSHTDHDPTQRQTALGTSRLVAEAPGPIKSCYLRHLNEELRTEANEAGISLLTRLNAVLARCSAAVELEQDALERLFLEDIADFDASGTGIQIQHQIAVKLGLLLQKWRAQEHRRLSELRTAAKAKGGDGNSWQRATKEVIAGRGGDINVADIDAEGTWARLVSRTDELYEVHEHMRPTFEAVMKTLVREVVRDDLEGSLSVAPLKDPVRLYEKANDEYGQRFSDGVLPEACVPDVTRCRVVLQSGLQIKDFVSRLIAGVKLGDGGLTSTLASEQQSGEGAILPSEQQSGEGAIAEDGRGRNGRRASISGPASILPSEQQSAEGATAEDGRGRNGRRASLLWTGGGELGDGSFKSKATEAQPADMVELQLVSLANMFDQLDPTHFRSITCSAKLTHRDVTCFCEIQVHYSDILTVAQDTEPTVHYNFFRTRLAGTVPETELDAILDEKLVFLVDATGIPVLLSLLVLIFTSGGEDLTKLPSNRIELYELGIESAIAKRLLPSGYTSSDSLVKDWLRLFNLDRSAITIAVASSEKNKEQKKEREHRTTRKAALNMEHSQHAMQMDSERAEKAGAKKKVAETSSSFKGDSKKILSLDEKEVYDVFKHGAHYLREAIKPEVQRTELNRIELAMPKKLVDTVMMLVNANLKMLLGDRAQTMGLSMLRQVAVANQVAGRREFASGHVAKALLIDQVNTEGITLWLHLNKEEAGLPLIKTLEAQTEVAPAQYQFKHLSFQEVWTARSALSPTCPQPPTALRFLIAWPRLFERRRDSLHSTCCSRLSWAGRAGKRTCLRQNSSRTLSVCSAASFP